MPTIAMEAFSLIGIIFLILSIFFVLNKKTLFPGWATLLPTLGAVLIIAAGPATMINRYVLGNRVVVFVGLISYPLYLWHWPFLSFPKITEGLELSTAAKIIAICGATLFAVLTYYCIERPLRQKGATASICLLITSLLLAFMGFLFWKGAAQPKQSGELFQKIAAAKNDHPENSEFTKSYDVLSNGFTLTKIGDGPKTTLYIGDSNVRQYFLGVERTILEMNGTRTALLGGCKIPILHIHMDDSLCEATNAYMFWLGVNNPDIDTVVLSAQWRSFFSYEYKEGGIKYPTNSPEAKGTLKAMDQLVLNIRELKKHGKKVYLILNIPATPELEPLNLIARSLRGFHVAARLEGGISLEKHKYITRSLVPITPLLEDVAQRSGAIILDPADFLCKNNWCSAVTEEGEPIYSDEGHLRGTFSYYHPQFIAQTLK